MTILETFNEWSVDSSQNKAETWPPPLTRMEINEVTLALATNGIARHCLLLQLSHDRVSTYTYVRFIHFCTSSNERDIRLSTTREKG